MSDTTWRKQIDEERGAEALEACTLSKEEMDVVFDSGYGVHEGEAFTAWTETRVLFPVVYDGAEWCGSVPRNPCDEASDHQGNG